MNTLKFAIRNLLRNRKRTIITVLTICFGFTALGVIGGILNNIFSNLKEQAIVNEKIGHLTLVKEGFFKNGKINPQDYLFTGEELNSIKKILNANEEIELITPRLSLFGSISNGSSSTIFISEAIIPEDDEILLKTEIDGRKERKATSLLPKSTNEKETVAISSELAQNMKIKKGDQLTLLTSTKDGIPNAIDVIIGNIYNTGNPATNDKFVLLNYETAKYLYDTEGAERIILTVKEIENLSKVKSEIEKKLLESGFKIETKTWDEVSLSYNKVKTMFTVIFRVLSVIISIIVLLTLMNTMQMNINERTKEIGTLRSIGMLKNQIIYIFCLEGILIGIIGCLIAIPVLFGLKMILQLLNITFIPPVASIEILVSLLFKPSSIIPVFLLFMVASLISSFVSSFKIINQKIINSLNYN
jgi:putative ABC transport system permease protein